ncbi:MAG TPA: LacI family DNA-binding transcriptional regulator [Actinotalea caeni]|uniref:LacI family DNA-binding transcriptional regulator n=1 Tax=Actinotalea caeni TaxID=1348467 RepID=UPI0012E2FFB7|nr:LacI family DNA-binding transcriptional regulator [Actinotalea caeni]HLV54632.1 LacI family DNA-binding transcriptional regulator [Actinotalea caeni]
MAGPTTLSDVAKEAGVSLATASRAINGSANRTVRPELRERVLAAAARLKYSPDANAQAMARGRTTTVGLIVHDIADPYFSSIAAGVTGAADRHKLVVTLATTQHQRGREVQFVEVMHSQRARAIVIAGGRYDDPEGTEALTHALAGYMASGGSAALIGQPLPGVSTIAIANTAAVVDLARALHGLGYRRFGILGGPAGHLTARDRREGFARTVDELGESSAVTLETAFTRDGGYDGMARLLAQEPDVELVFAVNDVMAVGAMAAARDAGREVGRDIAVAGFDDIVTLRDVSPGLTTVRLPLVELGARATELALEEAAGEPRVLEVGGEVVLRESTPPRT